MKKALLLLLCFMVTLNLSGCIYKSYYGKRPCDQPNTEWVSEDGTVYFSVNEKGRIEDGVLLFDDEIKVHVAIGPATEIDIYYLSDVYENHVSGFPFEHWVGYFIKDNEFVAVVKETKYFEVGQKIKFHRID